MGAPSHDSHDAEAEPQSPMWLPALGAVLFIGAAIWMFGTGKPVDEAQKPQAQEKAQERPSPPEARRVPPPVATDSGGRRPDPKQMEERIRAMQEQFRNRAPQPPPPPH